MQWGDAARIWAALTEGSHRRWRFSNRGRCSLWYSPENRRWTGKTWGCLHGAHHSVFPGTGAGPPGLLKQPCLTNQRLQEEIQGLLVSGKGLPQCSYFLHDNLAPSSAICVWQYCTNIPCVLHLPRFFLLDIFAP